MDGLLALLGLALALALVLGPVGFFLALGQRGRLAAMQQRLAALEAGAASAMPAPESVPRAAPAEVTVSAPVAEPPPVAAAPSLFSSEESDPGFAPPPAPLPEPSAPRLPRPPRRSLEETIGANWTVWAGALALGLGGVLLVRYSFEAGFFGPAARVIGGLLLAALLAAGGEYLRRAESGPRPAGRAYIPGALTAAGSVTAFASIYAAQSLYHFISPATALIALGATAFATLAAAMLHGPALAALGLVGAIAAPLFIISAKPEPWPLLLYLAIATAACHALAFRRGWLWLILGAALGAGLWLAPVAALGFAPGVAHLLLQTAMLAAVFALREAGDRDGFDRAGLIVLAIAGALGGLLLLLASDGREFGTAWTAGAGGMIALLLFAALAAPRLAPAAALAGLFACGALAIWPPLPSFDALDGAGGFANLLVFPGSPPEFQLFALAAALALGLGIGAHAMLLPPARADVAAWRLAPAGLAPLALLAIVYLRLAYPAQSMALAAVAVALACAFAAGAALARRRGAVFTLAQGVFATAAFGALSLAAAFALDGGYFVAALALSALASSVVAVRLDLPLLRWCSTAIGLLLCARLAYDPRIVGDALSATPVFNTLLPGYGIPAIAFALAAFTLRKRGDDTPARTADALAILFAALLAFFEIRHAMNAGDIFARKSGLPEQGLMTLMSFGFSLVLTRLDAGRANIVFKWASLAIAPVGFALAIVQLGLHYNPILDSRPVEGGAVLNTLLLGYLLPGAMAVALAIFARATRPQWYTLGAAAIGGMLLVLYSLLEIRVLFHGPFVGHREGLWLSEAGVSACTLLAFASMLVLAALKLRTAMLFVAGSIVFALALGAMALAQGFVANPLATDLPVEGSAFLDTLSLGYLLPALLCFALARLARQLPLPAAAALRHVATVAVIALVFAWLSLETRLHFVHPAIGWERGVADAEWYAYSAVWLLFGLALLAYGVARDYPAARYASGVFVLASTLKIFLFDMAGLDGFLRAASFIGLGLALIAIGLVYQKFVFSSREAL